MVTAPTISADCLGWASTAGYFHDVDETAGILRLWSRAGTRYYLRHRGDRLEVSEATPGEDPQITLFAATTMCVERYLFAVLGDEIRDDLTLPYLQLPSSPSDLATGYRLGPMERGYRILSRVGHGPVAAAPDPQLSFVTLVPLSHLLGLTVSAVKRAYLSEHGTPLLVDGRYADRA
ncbi:hypothetical protein JNN96_37720 [Mycobacterium sp. DSM 3803]|nr:hypothetical protein [Mycobacterium sp. DSM 3803]